VARATELGPGVVEDYARARSDMMKKLESDPELHKAMAEQLRKDFEENLNQSHDFLQLVKLVRGHAEVLLNAKYPELESADAAERLPTEGAIFFSTELMLVKMDSLIYLNEINRALGGESRVLVHPLVLKYVRIYSWQAEQKELSLRLDGQCYAACTYNSQAIGAVIQGLLDNLVKYAPAGSKGVVGFDETDDYVHLSFGHSGPVSIMMSGRRSSSRDTEQERPVRSRLGGWGWD
jgi:signal transduction histidine kinase